MSNDSWLPQKHFLNTWEGVLHVFGLHNVGITIKLDVYKQETFIVLCIIIYLFFHYSSHLVVVNNYSLTHIVYQIIWILF